MSAQPDVQSILNATANQILALVAPTTARLVRAAVTIAAEAETAATDGVQIQLPTVFNGVDVARDTMVAVGLLTHELGHFLQPLTELLEVAEAESAPQWLVNILADIQLEAMMAGLFPPLADTLTAVRTVVKQVCLPGYVTQIKQSRRFADGACVVALMGRYSQPTTAFDLNAGRLLLVNLGSSWAKRGSEFLVYLEDARDKAPGDLGKLITQIMQAFPELRQAPETAPIPGGVLQVAGLAGAAQTEAQANVKGHAPVYEPALQELVPVTRPPTAATRQVANGLRLHFQSVRGATAIVAPQDFNRRAAALDEAVPFRMTLPGRAKPAPSLVVCVDKSSSMKGSKFALAQQAAQAVALAVQAAQGQVVGVLFDDCGYVNKAADANVLFADPASLSYGGTGFAFLLHVWRRWPTYQVLLVTDGDGSIPPALPGDRDRTAVIIIPPDCDPTTMQQIATRVVQLDDLRGLADIMALLTPRK